jgi:hypothetical protein
VTAARSARLAALLASVLVLATAGAARAGDVSAAQLQQLARQASTSSAALARLRAVTSVDGVPVDLRRALGTAAGARLQGRLEALAPQGEPVEVGDLDARADAQRILADGRFHAASGPHPLRGLVRWVDRQIRPLGRPFDWLAARVPGGGAALWTVLGALVALAAALAAARVARQRSVSAVRAARARRVAASALDPAALERDADAAEGAGDYERALRLRFVAGLVRLDRAEAIEHHERLTSGELRRMLHSEPFDGLSAAFDEIVYGGRPATVGDARAAREGWPLVLEGTVRR